MLVIEVTLLIATNPSFAQLDTQWVKTFVGPSFDRIYSHIQTADGGFAFTGMFRPPNSFGGVWFARCDQDGELQISRNYFTGEENYGNTIIEQENGDFLIFGYTTTIDSNHYLTDDILIIQVNADGDSLWSKTYGGPRWDRAMKTVRTEDGGFAIAGVTTSWGGGREDFFLLKLDQDCDSLWLRTYGRSGVDICNDLIQTSDGGYALVGSTTMIRNAPSSYWALFLDESGDSLRSFVGAYDNVSYNVCNTIEEIDEGNFVISGGMDRSERYNNTMIWTVCLDANAELQWSRVDGSDNDFLSQQAISSCIINSNSIAICGMHYLDPEGGSPYGKLWILNVTADGEASYLLETLWDLPVYSNSILLTNNNELCMSGFYGREGNGTRHDGFLLKTSSLPNVIESQLEPSGKPTISISGYPNPFNSTLTIRYGLDKSAPTRLTIFDITGREVASFPPLLAGGELKGGSHTLVWDATASPAGVYFVKLQSGGEVLTKKVVLMR